jgi:hypothetical protein
MVDIILNEKDGLLGGSLLSLQHIITSLTSAVTKILLYVMMSHTPTSVHAK